MLHALLDISDKEALFGHASAGASYEGFVIETLLSGAPPSCTAYFYRSGAGAEIDLHSPGQAARFGQSKLSAASIRVHAGAFITPVRICSRQDIL